MEYNKLSISRLSNFDEDSTSIKNIKNYTFDTKYEKLTQYKLLIKEANYFYKKGELVKAYQFYEIAKKISIKISWHKAQAHCLMAMGNIQVKWGKFDAAYKIYMRCLNLIIDNDLNNSLSIIYFRLGDYYTCTKNHKLSKTYTEKAINSIKKTTFLE